MSVLTRPAFRASSWAIPKINLGGCVFYAPLWRPDLGVATGGTFKSKDTLGHVCTVTGATWGSQGRTFDGNDQISIPVTCTPPFTVVVWCKFSGLPSVLVHTQPLCDGTGTNDGVIGVIAGGDLTYIQLAGLAVVGGAITDLNWHMYTAIFNGAGSSIRVDTGTATTGTTGMATTTSPYLLGTVGNLSIHLEGIEGDVLFYNRALSAGEIMNNYLATKWRYQ